MDKITVKNDNAPDIRFTGELMARVKSSPAQAHPSYSNNTGRWTELELYKTQTGKFVCLEIGCTQWQGEHNRYKSKACNSVEEVTQFFGHGWLAKELYDTAELDTAIDLDAEEVGKALDTHDPDTKITKMLREARSARSVMVIATQNLSSLQTTLGGTEKAASILENLRNRIVLRDPEETLYINTEIFGVETYIGTKDEFRKYLADCIKQWHKEAVERGNWDGEADDSLKEYTKECLNDGLDIATPEDLKKYPRLDADGNPPSTYKTANELKASKQSKGKGIK